MLFQLFIANKIAFVMIYVLTLPFLALGSLLLRRECCTFSNGEYVKSGLAELEKWIVNTGEEASITIMLEVFSVLIEFYTSVDLTLCAM